MAWYWVTAPSLTNHTRSHRGCANYGVVDGANTMKKFIVFKEVSGTLFPQKSFDDQAKAVCFTELLADGKEHDWIKFCVAEVILEK